MSDKTQHLDTAPVSSTQLAVWFNELADALSQASQFGRRATTQTGSNWGYYGVTRWYINNTATVKANAVMAGGGGANYISADRTLAVAQNGSAFAPEKLALYKGTVAGGLFTDYEDHRDPHHVVRFLYGRFVLAMADANKTLLYEQAMCESMELTGALTALRDVTVPLVPRSWIVYANVTGGFGVRVIGASGTGITVADGKRALLECDGTNVVRITPDT